jgi:hypothetical protein
MDGGETVPEAGLSTGFIGRGAVTGSVADDGGETGADLMGTVFAVRDLSRDGRDVFFASGVAGAGEEGDFDGAAMSLVGSGAVFWAGVLTRDERDNFFVPCDPGARGEVVAVEEPAGPAEEGTAGAVGPIRMFFLARSPAGEAMDT